MSRATWTHRRVPTAGGELVRFEIDCRHATTGLTCLVDHAVPEREALRVALLRHHMGTGCPCVRRLWVQAFGMRWPELPQVRADAPSEN